MGLSRDEVRESSNKAVAVYQGAFIFVGHPVYEQVPAEREVVSVLEKIVDVYQMIIVPVPGQDRSGKVSVMTTITGFKLGELDEIGETASVVELSSDSQLYQSYVALSAGIHTNSSIV